MVADQIGFRNKIPMVLFSWETWNEFLAGVTRSTVDLIRQRF